MKPLLFLYVSHRSGSPTVPQSHYLEIDSHNKHVEGVATEGMGYLFKCLLEQSILDEVIIIIESAVDCGKFKIKTRRGYLHGYVVPSFPDFFPHLPPINPLIFVRAAHKPWIDWMIDQKDRGSKILFYGANTGRERWPFWDFILDDCLQRSMIDDRGIEYLPFSKPVNQSIFKFKNLNRTIDVCLGASNVHDKKGQWRGIEALKLLPGITAVVPGAMRHGMKTSEVFSHPIPSNITVMGELSRHKLSNIFNQTKLYLHLASCGQNDRGALEASACGCTVAVTSPKIHPSFLHRFVLPDDPKALAGQIVEMLNYWCPDDSAQEARRYLRFNGVDLAVEQIKGVLERVNGHS